MSDQSQNDSGNFPPDRTVWVAQLALLIVFVIATILSSFEINLPAPEQLALVGLVSMVISGVSSYLVPMARQEIMRRMTTSMVVEANNDKASSVNLADITVTPTAAPNTVVAKEKAYSP